ncbi:DUF5686 family protein [Rapidithrix thailandica]|uniref:DUF5686 family protein n=1 Tax=Rapidithrix thailandica TaxID=413964 RepID=A0AAW9SKD6_9BACT
MKYHIHLNPLTFKHFLPFTCLVFLLGYVPGMAQTTLIEGKVIDADTGDGIPFANVYFKNTSSGTTTDFDGFYKIETSTPSDSLTASYVGYKTISKKIKKGEKQTVNFQLTSDAQVLQEIEIVYGEYENPAWEILRNVVKQKKYNDKRALEAYQYETYSKTEIDIDNISEKFKKKKVVQKVINVIDSIEHIAGEDGKPILPIFISESLSEFYYNTNLNRKKEKILKSKISGVGIENGSTVSQLLGTTFQDYNFYKNWMLIAQKDFVSPISESWKFFYEYELAPKPEIVNDHECYRITFQPKRPEDLAFAGTMWITTDSYALKQIDVSIGKSANLNFIEKIKIQQQLIQAQDSGAWLPEKTRVLMDIGEIKNDWAGMLAKFYVSNKNFVINQPMPGKFFNQHVELAEDALIENGEDFWNQHRHEKLTPSERNVYSMIDTINNLPTIKTYVEIARILFYGYKSFGKIDIGPYPTLYAYNNIEGHRFQLGMRTNINFSKKFIFGGYAAYGTRDKAWKYQLEAKYIFSRSPWTVGGIRHKVDLDQVGIYKDMGDQYNSPLFEAASRFGTLRNAYKHTINEAWLNHQIIPGLSHSFTLRHRNFQPLFNFAYRGQEEDPQINNTFTTSEASYQLRIAFSERFILDDNDRVSLGTNGKPIFTLKYIRGIKGVINSDFNYDKFLLGINHSFRLGGLGRTTYQLQAGYIPATLPYPLLEAHLGNPFFFYNDASFNMMDILEFVSDQYSSLKVIHRFEGVLVNRVPLLRKLHARLFMTGNILYGQVSDKNLALIPTHDQNNQEIQPFKGLGDEPYVELGYGIENIFRFIRVDFIHRLTYLHPEADKFGIKFSAQLRL